MRCSGIFITNGQCIHSMRRFGSAEQLRKTAESTLETGDPAYALALTEPGWLRQQQCHYHLHA